MGSLIKKLIQMMLKRPPKKQPAPPAAAKKKAETQGSSAKPRGTPCRNCKKPNRRHDPCKTKGNDPTKEKNSMIDPDHADDVAKDIDNIIDGNVPKTGENWTVNGRTYGQHDGALHPVSGPGITPLNRMQHQVVKQMNTDPVNGGKFADALKNKGILSEKEIDEAMELWKKCKK